MSLPFGLKPDTIKPGAVRSMTSDKLATFSLGGTKKTPFQKHKEMLEQKRKMEEDAQAAELAQWQEDFESGGDRPKQQFVRGGVIQQGNTSSSGAAGSSSGGRGAGAGAPPPAPRISAPTIRAPQRRAPNAAAKSMFSGADDIDGEDIDGAPTAPAARCPCGAAC